MFVFSSAFYALLLASVLFLTQVWDYSILEAGFAITPGPLMAALAAPPGGRLSDRYGQRVVAVPGALLFAAGAGLLALNMDSTPDYVAEYLPAQILTGAGVGLSFASWSSAAVARAAAASGSPPAAQCSPACARSARSLGIAVLVAVLEAAPPGDPLSRLHERLDADGSRRGDHRRACRSPSDGCGRPRPRAPTGGGGRLMGRSRSCARSARRMLGPPRRGWTEHPVALRGRWRSRRAESSSRSCPATRDHCNPIGVVHGGLAATLLDSAMGCAVQSDPAGGVGLHDARAEGQLHAPDQRASGRMRAKGRSCTAAGARPRSPRAACSPRTSASCSRTAPAPA